MNREIKFRAWDNLKKKMFYDGDKYDKREHVSKCEITNKGIYYWIHETRLKNATGEHFDFSMMVLYPHITIMQFTGLKDKNEMEIFEGDIVHIKSFHDDNEFKVPVKFRVGAFFAGDSGQLFIWNDNCEVIGNIHQHPELLEGK